MSKRKPKANTLRTVLAVKRWIREHVKPYDADSGNDLPAWTTKALDAAALWWHACEEASTYGDLRTKDIACILLAGQPALTLANLQETLDSAHEQEDETEPAAQQIELNLREHFRGRMAATT